MTRPPISSLTGLRFVAAACVVLSHAVPKIVKFDQPPMLVLLLSQTAALGMTLFFVLSGFVIFYNYSGSIGSAAALWNFFVARIARLYPLFAVIMAYDLLLKFSFSQATMEQILGALPFYATLTQSWFYRVVGNHSLIFQFGWMPQVSWSISTEWFFYFVFPFIAATLLFLKSTRQRVVAAFVISAGAVTLINILNFHGDVIQKYGVQHYGPVAADAQDLFEFWLVYFSPYVRVFEFALGCCCAAIFMSLPPPSKIEERLGLYTTGAAVVSAIFLHVLFFGTQIENPILRILLQIRANFGFAPSLALLIFCCARYKNALVRMLSGKWILLGGEISYSMYLLHMLVINAFRYEAATITSWQVAVGAWLQLAAALASIIGLSLVTWTLIEMPARRAVRQGLRRTEPFVAQTKDDLVPERSG